MDKELLGKAMKNFPRERDSYLLQYKENQEKYRTCLNGILVIVGFSVTITAFLLTMGNSGNTEDAAMALSTLLSVFCCVWGIDFIRSDSQWKRRTDKSLFNEIFPFLDVKEEESVIREVRRTFIMLSRSSYQVNKATGTLMICSYLFLSSFFVAVLRLFLDDFVITIGHFTISWGVIGGLICIMYGMLIFFNSMSILNSSVKNSMAFLITPQQVTLEILFPEFRAKNNTQKLEFMLVEIVGISKTRVKIAARIIQSVGHLYAKN